MKNIMKEHFNYERNVMDTFRMLAGARKETLCPNADDSIFTFQNPLYIPDSEYVQLIFNSIIDDTMWVKWTDSSGKEDPPPDYYNNGLKLMMEVMRVDDNACIGKNGKSINPIRARESVLIKELNKNGFLDQLPPDGQVIVTADTKLPTEEDHNYVFYRDNFIRVIEKHKLNIPTYQQNHPGFKLIFFVFDESSMYMKLENGCSKKEFYENHDAFPALLHKWWCDEAFINVVISSKTDFLIWATPYKQAIKDNGNEENLPGVCIYDIKNMKIKTEFYKERRMVSTER